MRIEATQEGVIKGQLVDMIKDHSDKLVSIPPIYDPFNHQLMTCVYFVRVMDLQLSQTRDWSETQELQDRSAR